MKYVHENCSIESLAADIVSRKIVRSSFMEINSIGKCTTYKCKLNSEAVITKEIEPPKKPKYKENSNLNLGDKLECQELFLAVNTIKPLKIGVINHSGRHKAQAASTEHYTFAEISRQIPNIPKINLISNSPIQIGN